MDARKPVRDVEGYQGQTHRCFRCIPLPAASYESSGTSRPSAAPTSRARRLERPRVGVPQTFPALRAQCKRPDPRVSSHGPGLATRRRGGRRMTDTPDTTFGHRLRVTRIALGISEQEVAEKNSIRLR